MKIDLFTLILVLVIWTCTGQQKDDKASYWEKNCQRDVPRPTVSRHHPNVVWSDFRLLDKEAREEIALSNGDSVRIRHWGCESYALTYSFILRPDKADIADHNFWYLKAADYLEMLADTTCPIDLRNAADRLREYAHQEKTLEYQVNLPSYKTEDNLENIGLMKVEAIRNKTLIEVQIIYGPL